jgi:hypothetical protein
MWLNFIDDESESYSAEWINPYCKKDIVQDFANWGISSCVKKSMQFEIELNEKSCLFDVEEFEFSWSNIKCLKEEAL